MQMKIISAGVRLSCMVVMVKGSLEGQRHFCVELYRLTLGTWHGQDGKGVPRYLPTEDSLPIGHGIVGGQRSLCGQ